MRKITNSAVNKGKTQAVSTILRGPKESMPDGKAGNEGGGSNG